MSREDGFIEIDNRKLQVVTLDFETFYGKDYTLSGKINMSEYIRDGRFHGHGVGIKIGKGKTLWYTGKNIALALREIDWTKSAMLCHNTPFDGFICSHHFKVIPAWYLDTLSMSRGAHSHHHRHDLDTIAKLHGLGGKVKRGALANTKDKLELTDEETRALGGYCVDDVNDTYEIFWKLYGHIPDPELELIDLTVRMFCDPVLEIDIPLVEEELSAELGGKASALLRAGVEPSELMSNEKFAELLRKAGAQVPMKMSPSTGNPAYAFAKSDEGFKDLLTDANPQVVALAQARLKVKSTIGETRAVRFLEAGKDGMKLPVLLNYAGAHTHRWSGGNKMNLQNLKRGGRLRRSIKAPKGHVIVVADSAQIEARVLVWLAGQDDVVEAFAKDRDIYSEFASKIYGRKIDRKRPATNAAGQFVDKHGNVVATKDEAYKPDALEGFIGKVCILALGYGMGPDKLQATLKAGVMGPPVEMTRDECQRIVDIYRSANYRVKALWDRMTDVIASMALGHVGEMEPITYGKEHIGLPNGLFLQYFALEAETYVKHGRICVSEASYLTRTGRSKLYGGLLTENVVQALARCIIAEQILAAKRAGYRVVTTTHDEIVVVCKEAKAEKCLKDLLKIMSTPPVWAKGLPLAAEGGWDYNYSK